MSDFPDIEIRLDHETAVRLADALYALGEHQAAGTPLAPFSPRDSELIGRLLAQLYERLGHEPDGPTRWDALKDLGLHTLSDWGGPCPWQFTAWIEPEHKWLYFRIRGGCASMSVMPGFRVWTEEWEGVESYDDRVTVDQEPEFVLPLLRKLIEDWRAGRATEGATSRG